MRRNDRSPRVSHGPITKTTGNKSKRREGGTNYNGLILLLLAAVFLYNRNPPPQPLIVESNPAQGQSSARTMKEWNAIEANRQVVENPEPSGDKQVPSVDKSDDRPEPSGDKPEPSGDKQVPSVDKSDDRPEPRGDKREPSRDKPEQSGDKSDDKPNEPEPSRDKPEPNGDKPEPSGDKPKPSGDKPEPSGDKSDDKPNEPEPSRDKPEPSGDKPEPSGDKSDDKPEPSGEKPDLSGGKSGENPASNDEKKPESKDGQRSNTNPFQELQGCIDDYLSTGGWKGAKWVAQKNPCGFVQWSLPELAEKLHKKKLIFSGDSTTRADLRAFTDMAKCDVDNWDAAATFQQKGSDGKYDCKMEDQSMDLENCGKPPIVTVDCEDVTFRYVYKVWPWGPLDNYYFENKADQFEGVDALIISSGRWYPYWDDKYGEFDIEKGLDRYFQELRKLHTGTIIFLSEYGNHEIFDDKDAIKCEHGQCKECDQTTHCSYSTIEDRPERMDVLRQVMEKNGIHFVDRWKISEVLPHEYYEPWYCIPDPLHTWYCDHHLQFVGIQHLNLVANVLLRIIDQDDEKPQPSSDVTVPSGRKFDAKPVSDDKPASNNEKLEPGDDKRPQLAGGKPESNDGQKSSIMPFTDLQGCIDDYLSTGGWKGAKWVAQKNPCGFEQWSLKELTEKIQKKKLMFTGDSTTRADLRAFTDMAKCEVPHWDASARFQRKGSDGKYECAMEDQSMDLENCGQPPIVTVDCEDVTFRYVYKVWPWGPLDNYYFEKKPDQFEGIDALIISSGRWYPWWSDKYGEFDIEKGLDRYFKELRKIHTGPVIFLSEYGGHEIFDDADAVKCDHGACADCDQPIHCGYSVAEERPERMDVLRRVMDRNEIHYVDRWKISEVLPHEYYEPWYCKPNPLASWYCDHHLQFVGIQHLNLVANVLLRMIDQ